MIYAAGQHQLLQHVFRRHLKPKKQHEVARLALIAGLVAKLACTDIIVDVGSGQGHLSRLLAYGHNVRVVCIDSQDNFINGAKKFDSQLEAAVDKMKRKVVNLPPLPPSPRHSACLLQPDIEPFKFNQVLDKAWPELCSRSKKFGLVGLHTCGDLVPTMMRIFTKMPECCALVSVGCCYMKLSDKSDAGSKYCGYPMSCYNASLKGHQLSYEALEVACHAIDMYSQRLLKGADNLKIHCYRATLEEIIVQHRPDLRHAGLRSVSHAHTMPFSDYAGTALSRLGGVDLFADELHSKKTRNNLERWMQVVVFYSLRLLLAPVVESIILLDRMIYLYEAGVESILVPAFDPLLSPRNHVLIAIKKTANKS